MQVAIERGIIMYEPLVGKKEKIVAYACYDENKDTTKNKIVGKPLTVFQFESVESAVKLYKLCRHDMRFFGDKFPEEYQKYVESGRRWREWIIDYCFSDVV